MERIDIIGQRIRELREIFGCSTTEMSEKLGIAEDVYCGYETGGEDIPISVLFKLSGLYNVDMTELLTGVSPKLRAISVVRCGEGISVNRFKGYEYKDIGFKFVHRKMEPLIVTLQPDEQNPKPVMHTGQEINYCLEGEVILLFDDSEILLKPGDCAYFDATHPHGQKAANNKSAKFLTVIHE